VCGGGAIEIRLAVTGDFQIVCSEKSLNAQDELKRAELAKLEEDVS
jgi:hypothetical protein